MMLGALLAQLQPTGIDGIALPRHLLGAFRRKSISFCTGMTDETTVVYWFQSRSFSIDLRLPDGGDTPLPERQGWVGDTLWDEATHQLSWRIERSYQPRNQWPEPASLTFIGNSVLEFAPSGAYIEDWRQQDSTGPLLGLRLVAMAEDATGHEVAMEGGLVVAGHHLAFARSRRPEVDGALRGVGSLEEALVTGIATEAEVESYEVSVAAGGGEAVTHSTQPHRIGEPVCVGTFSVRPDGTIAQRTAIDGDPCTLLYELDMFEPDFAFGVRTPSRSDAVDWMEQEKRHLFRHAVLVR